jgi:alpha-L-fucosidase
MDVMKKLFILLTFSIYHFFAFAQVTGDEDKDMFNQAKSRDQKAIDEAVN